MDGRAASPYVSRHRRNRLRLILLHRAAHHEHWIMKTLIGAVQMLELFSIRVERWLAEREFHLREAFLARAVDRLDLERRLSHLERCGLPDPI